MKWAWIFGGLGTILTLIGHGLGLFYAPAEAMMGDVGRILYVHVPTAWVALLTYLIAFVIAIGSLWKGGLGWDAALEASVEVGVVLSLLLTMQGSIWAKPTWDVWWTWDPRLTTVTIMVVSYTAIWLMRQLISSPDRRAVLSAVATVVAFVNVPVVYMSVKWWRTIHQGFSSPDTVNSSMVLPLRIAALGMLFLMIGLVIARAKIALSRLDMETAVPQLPPHKPSRETGE